MNLKELLKDKTFPVKVTSHKWGYPYIPFNCYGIAADNSIFGINEYGQASTFSKDEVELIDWDLYTEPKPKQKYRAYLFKDSPSDVFKLIFLKNEEVITGAIIKRIPHLDFEE